MRLRAEQLATHLAKALAPVYAVHGDEPLLALEAADAVRAAARRRGYAEREVLFAERDFDWSELAQAGASRSLFGERKILELRLATRRPGAPASRALERYCERPNPEVLLLLSMPRPAGPLWWKAAWFAALDSAGVVVEVQPVPRRRLAQWIAQRLALQRQSAAPETLEDLADRVEGNLLAAHQEIRKLALLAPEGPLAAEQVRAAVASVARYDFETLAEALYAGELPRFVRALWGLRDEGESAAALAWRLGDELRALLRVSLELARGGDRARLLQENRIWRAAQPRCERALERLSPERLRAAALHVARIERACKGVGPGRPWDEFVRLGLQLRDAAEGPRPVG